MNTVLKLGCIALLALHVCTARSALTVTKIAAGAGHTLFVESDGSLWGMGYNGYGELGLGPYLDETNLPVQILSSNVTAVAAGANCSHFIMSDGSLWAMGFNGVFGALGDGSTAPEYYPEQIWPSNVTTIASGYYHSLFRTSAVTGGVTTIRLWAFGANDYGELGDGTEDDQLSPEQIESTNLVSHGVTALAGGYLHSLFVRADGSLWAMGDNEHGQLGDGTMMERDSRVEIKTNNVIAVAAGGYHSLFLKSDTSLWAMGYGGYGQLGNGTNLDKLTPVQVGTNVTAIAAGAYYSLFIKSDGSLWGMGDDDNGELGVGSTTNQYLPVKIVPSNVVAVAADSFSDSSFFIKSDGSLWAMGDNNDGQLGDGTTTNRLTPEQVFPLVPPGLAITSISLSKTNLIIQGRNGQSGGTYFTLMSTNLAKGLNQWTPVATNILSADGNFTFTATNAVSTAAPRRYYVLQMQ